MNTSRIEGERLKLLLTLKNNNVNTRGANNIITEIQSLDELENSSEEKIRSIRGVGDTTIEEIGIWDSQGNPVDSLEVHTCPSCGYRYDNCTRVSMRGKSQTFDKDCYAAVRVQTQGDFKKTWSTIYMHK